MRYMYTDSMYYTSMYTNCINIYIYIIYARNVKCDDTRKS